MKSSKEKMSKKLHNKEKISKKIVEKPKNTGKENKKEKALKIEQEIPIVENKSIDESMAEKIEIESAPEKIIAQVPQIKLEDNEPLKHEDTFNEEKNKVEALLFAYGKYIDESMIIELCDVDKKRIKKVLEKLREDYEQKDSALTIFQEGNSWKINVREKYLSIVRKIVADTELPKSVMETLAVIAWKSPIYQSEVVRMRGNKCYDHIEVLEEAGFILKDKKGRSYILKTTDKFYNYFEIDQGNLKSIFEEVKIPIKEEQKTLEENVAVPEGLTINEKIEHIEVKKWAETDEERDAQDKFLELIEGKIKDVQQKNALFEEELPSPKREVTVIKETIIEVSPDIDNSNEENAETKPAEQPSVQEDSKKTKSLTKKQLEKKFKDDILRVREQMDKK
jgi:segregation and condensation protein B